MQTTLIHALRDTSAGREAAAVIGKCVHCGFCLATCPTYQVLGDELDSPRGRIYLIKQTLEGKAPTAKTQLHLDRCLTCRACETTCPSGVDYHALLDTGRALVEAQVPRGLWERARRRVLLAVLRRRWLFTPLARLGRAMRWLLPASLRRQLEAPPAGAWPKAQHPRRMLMLQGCVQPGLRPSVNAAAARVLDRAGITTMEVRSAGCCGALRFHNGLQDEGLGDMRRLIDAWWPHVEAGAEAIVITASGCGAQIKDYGRLLRDDPKYAEKAARITALAKDIAEVVEAESGKLFASAPREKHKFVPVAFQSPCTLQHGQRIKGVVELLLKAAGYELTPVPEAHLCCGSAGTYSIFHPEIAQGLRSRKVEALDSGRPTFIASANIGCIAHLGGSAKTPPRHWIELIEASMTGWLGLHQ